MLILYKRKKTNELNMQLMKLEKEQQQKYKEGSSCHGSVVMNPTSIHEDTGSILGLTQWIKDPALLQATV